MRTIHVIASRGVGGGERFFARLAGALAAAGHETRALIRPANPLAAHLDGAVATTEIDFRGGIDVRSIVRVRRILAEWRPRVVQTYMERGTRLTRVPRSSETLHVARLGGHYKTFWFRHADVWVGNARNVCDYLVRKGFPPARVHLIGNFVPLPDPPGPGSTGETRRSLGVEEDDWLLVALGRFVERKKAFGDLVRSVAALPDEPGGRRLRVVIGGDGPERDVVRRAVAEAGVGERVLLPGWIDDPSALLHAADALVCSSRVEALGNVVLEGWSHGLPVVSTRAAGPAELIEDGETGLLADPGRPDDLARAIRELLEGPAAWRRAMGERGRHLVETRYSRDEIRDRYLELYETATRRR